MASQHANRSFRTLVLLTSLLALSACGGEDSSSNDDSGSTGGLGGEGSSTGGSDSSGGSGSETGGSSSGGGGTGGAGGDTGGSATGGGGTGGSTGGTGGSTGGTGGSTGGTGGSTGGTGGSTGGTDGSTGGTGGGSTCGNGTVEGTEECDPGSSPCCNDTCDGVKGQGTECRAAVGACDVAESCDGVSAACPSDGVAGTSVECRAANGACDVAESCDGASKGCPADAVATQQVQCRAANGECDVPESCDGVTKVCPVDGLASAGTECRAASGACDVAESCDGSNKACPADGVATVVTECRGANGACDVAETCDGTNKACPTDGFEDAGTTCRPALEPCDLPEICTGTSAACPSDSVREAGFQCRAASGVCDVAESCDGASKACPNDAVATPSVQCRAAADACDVAEACDGASKACPFDALHCSETVLDSELPIVVAGSNVDTCDLHQPSCGYDGDPGGAETVFHFVAPSTGGYVMSTFGSSFDTQLYVLDGLMCGAEELACNEDADPFAADFSSLVTIWLERNQEVDIVVEGYDGATGDVELSIDYDVTCASHCALTVIPSIVPQTLAGGNVGTCNVYTPSCGFGNNQGGNEAVFEFEAPFTGTFVFDTSGSDFDTFVGVFEGTACDEELACDDDGGSTGLTSRVSVALQAGQVVRVVVDGFEGEEGNVELSIDYDSSCEDHCAVTVLPSTVPQTVAGSNVGTCDMYTPSCGYGNDQGGNEAVFEFEAPFTGTFAFDTSGSDFDTFVGVFEGTACDEELACDDDGGSTGLTSRVTVALQAGQVVRVVVDGYSGEEGDIQFTVTGS